MKFMFCRKEYEFRSLNEVKLWRKIIRIYEQKIIQPKFYSPKRNMIFIEI
jgi:hypothetical protein